MNIIQRIRTYHAALAILSTLAYLTGDFGIIHAWLGYGVAVVIAFRFFWALSGERMIGLTRFYPSFKGLNATNLFTHPAISKALMLGIVLSVISVTATGIALDRGESIGLAEGAVVTTAYADDDDPEENHGKSEVLEEVHEFFANMMLLFVGMHVSYLLLFKRPLAKFMLFIPKQRDGLK